jgi:phosphoribosylamine--glycine ligase
VVLASPGYPDTPRTGLSIHGLNADGGLDADGGLPGVNVFHAGTARRDGQLVTAGGRVLGVQAQAPDISKAIAAAYEAVGRIRFDGVQFRHDIGRRALARP